MNNTKLPDANGNYKLSTMLPPLGEEVLLWDSWGVVFIGQRMETFSSSDKEAWAWTVDPSRDVLTFDDAEFTHWARLNPPVDEETREAPLSV